MTGQVETAKDLGEKPDDVARRWLRELELSGTHEKDWRQRAEKIVERYRDDDRKRNSSGEDQESRFNILFANTEVLKGVMYQRTPVPDVRRRFLDKDPVGRQAALILQRALSYSVDSYDFDSTMRAIVEDVLLPGRGVAFVKYVPTMGMVDVRIPLAPASPESTDMLVSPDGKMQVPLLQAQNDEQGFFTMAQEQRVVYESVECDYAEWDMFRMSPAKRWGKVRWVAFGELLTREDLVKQFGDAGKLCELHWAPEDKENENDDLFKRALVWTIWNKTDRKVYVVSEGLKSQCLKVLDDPLGLEGFFPCPKPVYSISTTTKLIPVPEYVQYQDQACELDELTQRIEHLTDGLRRRGLYDSTYEEIQKLKTAGDNEFIPVENLAKLLADKGGLASAIFEEPLEKIAQVLAGLYTQRDQVKQTIYEVTGIADIVRGSTKSTETLGAQELKARYANVRTGPRQSLIAKFARDIFRIKAEIISERFDPTTLKLMTGPDLWMVEKTVQGPQGPVKQPADATNEIMALLRNERLRGFRVDVETDSTIQPDASEEQRNRIEFLTAVTQFVATAAPGVQAGYIPADTAKEFLSFAARSFKVSPQLEEALDKIGQSDGQADPAKQQQQQMQQAAMQADMATKNAQAQKAQAEAKEAEARAHEALAKALIAAAQAQSLGIQIPGMQQAPSQPGMQAPATTSGFQGQMQPMAAA